MKRFLFALILFGSCSPAPIEEQNALEEFEAIADRLEATKNPYVGLTQLPELRAQIASASNPVRKAILQGELAVQLLRIGEVEDAVSLSEQAVSDYESFWPKLEHTPEKIKKREKLKVGLAQAYLRQAEVSNCIARHNRDCCIFPLKGGGVHTEKGPAQNALAIYIELAKESPENLSHRWMCNLLSMALAEYPDGLPAELVIPIEAFESEYDIGRFSDVATVTGADIFSLCGGSAIDDFDGDGLLDIVASNFDPRGSLAYLRNDGQSGFDDKTIGSNLNEQLGGLNLIAADYDSDGDPDLFVIRGAWLQENGHIRNSLLRNDGSGVFTDVTREAKVDLPANPSQTSVFGDFNSDGHLDLYVGSEAVRNSDKVFVGLPSQLFLNDGEGAFELSGEASNNRYCKGVTAGDYDNDGDLDLYISNIEAKGGLGINRLYENDGKGGFKDVAEQRKVDGPSWSFATWFFDYDNDGWLDIYVGGYQATVADVASDYLGLPDKATRPSLYHNENGTFKDVAKSMGLDRPFLPMGANFGDYDNDGWLDIYLATGSPPYDTLMPNIALRNDRAQRFQDVTDSGGLGHLQKGHGVTFADFDNDGDQDIFHELGGFLPGDGFANALFENPGHDNRFLQIEFVGTKSNRSGYGCRIRVVVETETGIREIHRAQGSTSSFGGSAPRLEIGLGTANRIQLIEIVWPTSNITQSLDNVPLDSRIEVVEGTDGFELLPRNPFVFGGE